MESLVDSESSIDELPQKNQSEVTSIFGHKSGGKRTRSTNIVTKEDLNRVSELLSNNSDTTKQHAETLDE